MAFNMLLNALKLHDAWKADPQGLTFEEWIKRLSGLEPRETSSGPVADSTGGSGAQDTQA